MLSGAFASGLLVALLAADGGEEPVATRGGSSVISPASAAAPAPTDSRSTTATTTAAPASGTDIVVSRETTFVTEPRTADGALDLIGAINEKYGEGIAPEQNAAVLLYEALGPQPNGTRLPDRFFMQFGVPAPPEDGGYFVDLWTHLEQSEGIDGDDPRSLKAVEDLDRAMSMPWRREELSRIATWLDANERPLELVVRATRRPRYFSPIVVAEPGQGLRTQLRPAVHSTRELARALIARAMLHLGEGRAQDAWEDLLTAYRLARLVGQGATVEEAFTSYSVDHKVSLALVVYLRHADLPEDTLARCAQDWDDVPPPPDLAEKMSFAHRLEYIETALILAAGGEGAEELLAREGMTGEGFAGTLAQPWFPEFEWNSALCAGNLWYDRLAEALREEDDFRRRAAVDAMIRELETLRAQLENEARFSRATADSAPGKLHPQVLGDHERLVRAIRGASEAVAGKRVGEWILAVASMPYLGFGAPDRTKQRQVILRTAIALARYRADIGRYPQRLDELVPRYLPDVPVDLYTGRPVIYQPQENGYLLYSVGPDDRDDDGRGTQDEPAFDDLTVRMESASDAP